VTKADVVEVGRDFGGETADNGEGRSTGAPAMEEVMVIGGRV
jgi:hypothetical protein